MNHSVLIVQCVNNLDLGGLERMVLSLAHQLKTRGYDSAICCIENRGKLADEAEQLGIPVHALNMSENGKLATLRSLCALGRQHQPVVIHSHNFKPFYYAALARLLNDAGAHVQTRHGAFTRRLRAPWRYRVLRLGTDALVAVSTQGRQELARLIGWPIQRIGIIANGVDVARFQPATDKGALRRKLGLPEACRAVVVVARLAPEKNLETLLQAFGRIPGAGPDTELWIVGDGPQREHLETLCQSLGLQHCVRFLGARGDVPEIMAAADVGALSSISEGLSLSLIEAAACGLPIVATDVGDNAKVVNPPAGGRVVPPRDPAALAAALAEVLNDAALRVALGQQARAHVLQHFALDRMVDGYIQLYEQALTGRVGRS